VPLIWDGQYLLDQSALIRGLERRIPKARTDGGKTLIAATSAYSTSLLQVFQKSSDERCIEIIEGQRRWRFLQLRLSILEKYAKGVSIGDNGVLTRVPLGDQVIGEKCL
jgi:hypothetical protein